ncbi:hypothetical protein JOC77_000885 [Peribacillus deserti]|uniref:Uncharacterized protein n=1 Tax=Peribacillus deserti TaxID=673318 RepID=A0ABS2QEQ8_9BACI|nr:hypothetical protein [Peribacillus deserti]MBM7691480.1 hypothetical protein [Peribacillus deserti]
MDRKHGDNKRVKITTGPFLVPSEIGSELQGGRENDRVVIILKNPTNKRLQAKVKISVALQPGGTSRGGTTVFRNLREREINLGTFVVQPNSVTRIERNITGAFGLGNSERNAVLRVTAKGDFKVSRRSSQPVSGLLEISVVGGSVFNPSEPGLEQGDPVTFFRFKDFILVDKKHDHDD